MSYFEDASVVFIASAVKDGKTYSIKPTDGSGDLTFSRGSDIEATRVASNGYIQKAAVNLLLQSNTFSNATWIKGTGGTGVSVTSGQSGYDGSSDAWLLAKNAAVEAMSQSKTVDGVQTLSIYVKSGTLNWLRLGLGGGTFSSAYFDLSGSGALGSTSAVVTSKIESVASGWFRCSVVVNKSVNAIYIYPADADGDTSGTSGNIVIQDAQLNYGLVAQEYQETTTTSVVSGITNDMPRLDYSGGASCPSLKLEPSRTNALSHSEYMGNGGSSVDRNTSETLSPEGVYNAAKVTGSASYLADSRLTSVFSGNNVFSVFLKKGNDSVVGVYMYDGGYYRALFNLDTGAVDSETNTTASIQPYGNGWYRCTILATTTANVAEVGLDSLGGYVYTYGWQHEYNVTYPTSLIPTYGTSATRTADACSKTGISSLIGQTEGTIFIELGEMNTAAKDDVWIELSDGTTNNRILIYNEASGKIRNQIKAAGTISSLIDSGITLASGQKIAITYKTNEAKIFINGVQRGSTDTSVVVPAVGNLYFSNFTNTIAQSRTIAQALLFKTVLSDAECIELTTL
jgi:hypothetical protein